MNYEREMEDPVGNPAVSGAGVSPPADPEQGPPSKPDDRIDALLLKLEGVDARWGTTFAASPGTDPKAYARLQKVMNTYGYTRVRRVLEYIGEKRLTPQGASGLPLTIALCKRFA